MKVLARVPEYAKAVASALSAGGTALGVAMADGALNTGDVVSVVLAVLGALGIVYAIPNKDPEPQGSIK